MDKEQGRNTPRIERREALRRLGALGLGAAAASSGCLGARRPAEAPPRPVRTDRPNILVIIADDLGYGDVGCYGCRDIKTPNIDGLARDGARLTQFYVAMPLCAPTRVSILTGRSPLRTSLPTNPDYRNPNSGLSPDEILIPEVLKQRGYVSGLVGKWHLGYAPKFRPLRQGFDEYWGFLSGWADYYEHTYRQGTKWMFHNDTPINPKGYMTDLLGEHAVDFIRRHRDDPFYLQVAFNAPHWPEEAPPAYIQRSRRGVFGAMVECLDDNIGRILAALDELDLSRQTLVIFVSDNGADERHGGDNGPLKGGKGQLTEGGIRVPFVARWPGRIPAGIVVEEPVISMDIFSTVAAVAGAREPSGVVIDGRNIIEVLEGRARSPHDTLYWGFRGNWAVRRGP